MAKITYDDKVALNPQPSIADINKFTNANANEIKSVVNANAFEIGSNTNGNYIKYENGTMICWGKKTIKMGTWSADGNIFEASNNSSSTIVFPQEFYASPSLSLTELPKNVGYWENWFGRCIWDATGVSYIQLFRPNTAATDIDFVFSFIAVGRWKE